MPTNTHVAHTHTRAIWFSAQVDSKIYVNDAVALPYPVYHPNIYNYHLSHRISHIPISLIGVPVINFLSARSTPSASEMLSAERTVNTYSILPCAQVPKCPYIILQNRISCLCEWVTLSIDRNGRREWVCGYAHQYRSIWLRIFIDRHRVRSWIAFGQHSAMLEWTWKAKTIKTTESWCRRSETPHDIHKIEYFYGKFAYCDCDRCRLREKQVSKRMNIEQTYIYLYNHIINEMKQLNVVCIASVFRVFMILLHMFNVQSTPVWCSCFGNSTKYSFMPDDMATR